MLLFKCSSIYLAHHSDPEEDENEDEEFKYDESKDDMQPPITKQQPQPGPPPPPPTMPNALLASLNTGRVALKMKKNIKDDHNRVEVHQDLMSQLRERLKYVFRCFFLCNFCYFFNSML